MSYPDAPRPDLSKSHGQKSGAPGWNDAEMPPTPDPGNYAAPPTPPPPPGDPILVSIGDIHCTRSEVITPAGNAPLAGSRWSFVDMSRTTNEIPQWALIVAIVTAVLFCGLGLLFLLVKEERTVGFVQITVSAGPVAYTTAIPVTSRAAVADLGARVNYAQTLAYSA